MPDLFPTSSRILLVSVQAETLERLERLLVTRLIADVTCALGSAEALNEDRARPHDLVIAEIELGDMDGLALARQLNEVQPRPIILTTGNPTVAQAVEAIRAGAKDLLIEPFTAAHLLDRARTELDLYYRDRHRVRRGQRLRRLVRQANRDRRALNEKITFLCRDVVGAHRRLVEKIAAGPDSPFTDPSWN